MKVWLRTFEMIPQVPALTEITLHHVVYLVTERKVCWQLLIWIKFWLQVFQMILQVAALALFQKVFQKYNLKLYYTLT